MALRDKLTPELLEEIASDEPLEPLEPVESAPLASGSQEGGGA